MTIFLGSLALDYLITSQEREILNSLERRLQEIIRCTLFYGPKKEDTALIRFIFRVIKDNRDIEENITIFFNQFFIDCIKSEALDQLKNLEKKGLLRDFFEIAAQRKRATIKAVFMSYFNQNKALCAMEQDATETTRASFLDEMGADFGDGWRKIVQYLESVAPTEKLPLDYYYNAHRQISQNQNIKPENKWTLLKTVVQLSVGLNINKKGISTEDASAFVTQLFAIQEDFGEEYFEAVCQICVKSGCVVKKCAWFLQLFNDLEIVSKNSLFESVMACMQKGDTQGALDLLMGVLCEKDDPTKIKLVMQGRYEPSLKERFKQMPFPLSKAHIDQIFAQYDVIQDFCEKNIHVFISDLISKAHAISAKSKIVIEDILQLIAIVRLALLEKYGLFVHNTQVLTVLGQLQHESGAIVQVNTGEGKSLIITLMASVWGLLKKSVHIVSSSSTLAERDQERFAPFFNLFNRTSSCIKEWRKKEVFQADILYGSASDFEFGLMYEMMDRKDVFVQKAKSGCGKRFDVVIVDEVDNLTVDTFSNASRIAYPDWQSNDWVYAPIYRYATTFLTADQTEFSLEVGKVRKYLSEIHSNKFSSLLSNVSDQKLLEWLYRAHRVHFKLKINEDYILEEGNVKIVDAENTGRILEGSRWEGGTHEFIEVKHQLRVEQATISPLALSHPVFYSLYGSIFGLTGTLGDATEREEIYQIYGIPSFDVPTFHPPQRVDIPPKIFTSESKYTQAIIEEVSSHQVKGRPVLVLCETIKKTQLIQELLTKACITHEILNETQEKGGVEILKAAGNPGAITIATNNAARGTDIILADESLVNGGLHVVLAHFPKAYRVEQQARGRAGRQGNPGSSAMLVLAAEEEPFAMSLELLYGIRDARVKARLKRHTEHALFERKRFEFSKRLFDLLRTLHDEIHLNLFKMAEVQASRVYLNREVTNLTGLELDDQFMAKWILQLKIESYDKKELTMVWSNCMGKIFEKIVAEITTQWADCFNRPLSELILTEEGDVQRERNLLDGHATAFQFMESRYEKFITDWEPYLQMDGSGILLYIEKIKKGIRPFEARGL